MGSSVRNVDLAALKELTNEVVRSAITSREAISGPVNWADLKCFEAARVETDDGTVYLQVSIDEAAPEAEALHDFIREGLSFRGFDDVNVVTEW